MKEKIKYILNYVLKRREAFVNNYFYFTLFFFIIIRIMFILSTNIGFQEGEEDNIWNVLKCVNGRKLYTSPIHLPFEIYLYTPVSEWINIFIIKFFQIKDIHLISIMLRSLSLTYNLITTYSINVIIKNNFLNISKNNRLWLIGIGFITLIHLNWTIRVDSLSILFLTLTIKLFLKHLSTNNLKTELILALLIVLSIFTKQDGIQTLFLIPLALLLTKNYYKSFRVLIYSLSIIIITLSILYKQYGENLFISIIGGVNSPKSISTALSVFFRYLQLYNVLSFYIFIIILWGLTKYKLKIVFSLTILAIGSFGFALLTSMKLGAWVNYFTFFNIIGILLIASYLDKQNFSLFKSKLLILIFLTFYIGNLVFNYIMPEFKFDNKDLLLAEKESIVVRKILPENAIVYTNNDIMELCLSDLTIFPNQVFYSGIGKFNYNLNEINYKPFYVIGTSKDIQVDFILNNMLGLKKKNYLLVKKLTKISLFKIIK
jgi:hypothetical protein